MLLIPHSTALDLEGRPYVTYAVILLCIVVYLFQANNNELLYQHSGAFCTSIYDSTLEEDDLDVLRTGIDGCIDILGYFSYEIEYLLPGRMEKWPDYFSTYRGHMDEVMGLMQEHYEVFQRDAPESLDAKLMYYPTSWNPLASITSSLAHGDFLHIFFNLVFFFAFAPALELLIGNALKYLGILVVISFATSICYSLAVLISGEALPTLGLSGVVMGMLGLSAYLMPTAKIRVFIWFFFYMRTFFISAWIVALWYIGWDTWTLLSSADTGSVNVVAHVSGGFAGYLIGLFWLKNVRSDTREDLEDEIEYQRSKRADRFTSHDVSFSGNRRYIENKQREKQATKDYDEHMGRLYQYVSCKNDGEAVALMLEDYELHSVCPEIYEEKFQRMREWGASRAVLCMGRVCISLLLTQRLYKRAFIIAEQCQAITKDFVLADPEEVLLLYQGLINLQQYEVAYYLIHDAGRRYGEYIDTARCRLMEIELLWKHLEKHEAAHTLLKTLLVDMGNPYKSETLVLAESMKRI